jgi:hypothetical protein
MLLVEVAGSKANHEQDVESEDGILEAQIVGR